MRGGFTLIELVVVLTIVGIISLAVTPRIAARPKPEAAAELASLLRVAAMSAARHNRTITLQIAGGRYSIAAGQDTMRVGSLASWRSNARFVIASDGSAYGDTVVVGTRRFTVVTWTADVQSR
jgi:prepilin-type N-terminal cleavage/methylation domain-containing protein